MTEGHRAARRISLVIATLLVVSVAVFGALIVQAFNRALEPELERRSSLIGATVRDDTERALGLGIPLAGLVGTEPYIEALIADFPEVTYIAIRDQTGVVLHAGGALPAEALDPDIVIGPTTPIVLGDTLARRYSLVADGVVQGNVDVGVDAGFARSKLEDLALDIGVILLVALVLAYEVALAISERVAGTRQRALAGAADIRLILFLFVVGEELSKSFLPQFILSVGGPTMSLDPALAVSLPIMAYLLTLAIASPFAGRLSTGIGHRRLLLLGLAIAAASHLGMIFATELGQVVLLRGSTGIGYALATIASLEYMIDRMPGASRARTMGAFVAVVIGGTFAGTALGGVLADRLGFRPVFAISVVLILGAAFLAWRTMASGRLTSTGTNGAAFRLRDVAAVLRQPRLVALLAGVTVPMNVLMAAFLWYLVPLTLAAGGDSPAVIGRTLMLYYLAVLLAGPLVSRMSEWRTRPWLLVGAGSVVSGAILLLPALETTTLTISFAVLVMGIGHAAIRGPQLTLALEIAEHEVTGQGRGATLAAMRMLERLGSLVGLLVAAIIAARFDLITAMAGVGTVVAIAGAAYLGLAVSSKRKVLHA